MSNVKIHDTKLKSSSELPPPHPKANDKVKTENPKQDPDAKKVLEFVKEDPASALAKTALKGQGSQDPNPKDKVPPELLKNANPKPEGGPPQGLKIDWAAIFASPNLLEGKIPQDKVADFLLLGFFKNAQGYFMVGDILHHMSGSLDKIRLALVQIHEQLGMTPETFMRLMQDQKFGEPLTKELFELLKKDSGDLSFLQLQSVVENVQKNYSNEGMVKPEVRLRQQVERDLIALRQDKRLPRGKMGLSGAFSGFGESSEAFANVYELLGLRHPQQGKTRFYPFVFYAVAITATVLAVAFVLAKMF